MSASSEVSLQLEDVGVTYPAANRRAQPVAALQHVSLSLKPGVIVGLAGANGAGKTTLLELCVGALKPTHGSVQWFGRSTWDGDARARIGFCPDVPALPQRLTAREVIEYFAALDGVARVEAARRIDEIAERLRLSDVLGQRVVALSRGTVQRLGVLQALVRQRDVLLCDESFGPLDPVAQVDLRGLLREEASRGTAILVSSHQLDQLGKVADEIFILAHGRVIRHLGPSAVKAKRMLVLDVAKLDGNQCAALRARFEDGWLVNDELNVPWANDTVDEAAFSQSLPASCSGVRVVGMQDLSLESMFLDAIEARDGAQTSDGPVNTRSAAIVK